MPALLASHPPPPRSPARDEAGGLWAGTRSFGVLGPHPGDGDHPHPSGPQAKAGPPGAKSLFYLLPETRGSGLPGPPCVWGVGVCAERVCVCVCGVCKAVSDGLAVGRASPCPVMILAVSAPAPHTGGVRF